MWIPVIDLQVCKGGGDCVTACPDNAIAIRDKKAVVDYNRCTCCGVCNNICRHGALTIKIPEMPANLVDGVQLITLRSELKLLKQEMKTLRKALRRYRSSNV
ncbi:MAG: 4Fe-4S dicluster domain-containing protein [Candidatus Methanospirareceae archaeon]